MLRFQREAEVLASLNHPNIAHIYGVEERALVMELVEGESPKGPLPFEDAWKIALQIADALEYAHEKGVIHRDLKPANVKLTPDGVVKLLDFGLAKAFSETPEAGSADPENSPTITLGATVAGTVLGTGAYMSPEQAKGKRVDKRADIWSWGVVLYELECEKLPRALRILHSRNVRYVSFFGGEPLLHPRIAEMIRMAVERGMGTALITNGWLLPQLLDRLAAAGLKTV
jgi:serine/threonine protein kinase